MKVVNGLKSALVISAWLIIGNVTADLINDHGRVGTFISAGPGFVIDSFVDGNGTLDSEEQELINGVYVGSGRARAEQNGTVLRARSDTLTAGTGNGDFVTTIMSASYRDVLEVTGSGAPPAVRFNFAVDAVLSVGTTSAGGVFPDLAQASVAVEASGGILSFPQPMFPPNGTHATLDTVGGSAPATNASATGWDSTQFIQIDPNTYAFEGSFSFVSNLLTAPDLGDGAYFISVTFESVAVNRRSSATANGFDTMTLQSITLPDGSPLPSAGISFQLESGAPIEPDDDMDGVANGDDNCLLVENPGQEDTNGDNFGNACDPDISGPGGLDDCQINFIDLAALSDAFLSVPGAANWNPDADFDSNLTVNFVDLSIMANAFFGQPGPSGLPNACEGAF